MLRVHFLQQSFNLSDPTVAKALRDSAVMCGFVGMGLGRDEGPHETRACRFRHLLERHKLGMTLLASVDEFLTRNGIKISDGTIVDATTISAPNSTKNRAGEGNSGMRQTPKGQQRFVGVMTHVVFDSRSTRFHNARGSAANVADRHPMS